MSFRPLRTATILALGAVTACQSIAPTAPPGPAVSGADPTLTSVVAAPGALVTERNPSPIETVGGETAPAASFIPHELVVAMDATADTRAIARQASASIADDLTFSGRYARLVLPAGASLTEAARRLQTTPGVRGVEFNWRVTPSYLSAATAQPNNPSFSSQWGHRAIHSVDAWHLLGPGFSAAGTIIAVLDTGLDTSHPKFAGRILPGINLTSDNPNTAIASGSDVTDQAGHGTHVAGIAAAMGNDGVGVCGLAWDAKILPVKVLGQSGGSLYTVMKGLHAIADYVPPAGSAVRAANLSLGVEGHFATDAAMEDAMAYAWRHGIVVVVAAGNASSDVTNPAVNPHGIAVSATGRYQVGGFFAEWFAGFSNRGDRIDVAAPGGEILSTLPQNTNDISTQIGLRTRPIGDSTSSVDPPYGYLSGTSMAAPFVTGLAALIAARYDPNNQILTSSFADKVRARLQTSADDLGAPGKDPLYGYGRINALQALSPTTM